MLLNLFYIFVAHFLRAKEERKKIIRFSHESSLDQLTTFARNFGNDSPVVQLGPRRTSIASI